MVGRGAGAENVLGCVSVETLDVGRVYTPVVTVSALCTVVEELWEDI